MYLAIYRTVYGYQWTQGVLNLRTRRNAKWFRGGLVSKAHRSTCVSLNSRLESDKEEEEENAKSRLLGIGGALKVVARREGDGLEDHCGVGGERHLVQG